MLHCYREELTIVYLSKYFIFNENNYNPAKTCRLLQPAVDLCLFGFAVAGILVVVMVVVVVVITASGGAQMVVMDFFTFRNCSLPSVEISLVGDLNCDFIGLYFH